MNKLKPKVWIAYYFVPGAYILLLSVEFNNCCTPQLISYLNLLILTPARL